MLDYCDLQFQFILRLSVAMRLWLILDSKMSVAVAVIGRRVTWTLTLRSVGTTHSVAVVRTLS